MTSSVHSTPATRRTARHGFTLTELLIVIALIVLLVSLLLAALSQVQAKARRTSTLATMNAFANACDVFQQDHGRYPGAVPEDVLAATATTATISGTENALLDLMGGATREAEVGTTAYNNAAGTEVIFSGNYRVKIDLNRMGDGPVLDGKPWGAYFTPSDKEFGFVEGQFGTPGALAQGLPDLIDSWGQPIIALRRTRSVGQLAAATSGVVAQFDVRPTFSYLNSTQLGYLETNQTLLSILRSAPDTLANFARLLEHPALPGQSRGAMMLISSGADGIYYSAQDGPGAADAEVRDISVNAPQNWPASVVDEYDDVLIFAGS